MRATIILVGSGTVGKTTLVHYLRDKSFSVSQSITDGIEMNQITINDIKFSLMDFAGQKDYAHSHSIFFREDAIYLALFMPRSGSSYVELENFLQMIDDAAPTAPVILVTTRADEATLSKEEEASLRSNHPHIIAVMPVDSKSGRGIEKLEQLLANTALGLSGTIRKVPKLFFQFESLLDEFSSQNRFALTHQEFLKVGVEQIKLSVESANLARDLFNIWGSSKILGNGDIVLKPQQLANVLACAISTKRETLDRIGAARDGLLKYDEESLRAIWGGYDRRLWVCEDGATSSFIALLHDSGLAYPLYDLSGKAAAMSLVVAMLPERPPGHPPLPLDVTDTSLYELFIGPDLNYNGNLSISFNQMPSTFISQLQVRTRFCAMIGGAWKHGCALVVKNEGGQDSYAIVYEVGNSLIIISAGKDNSARSVVLLNIISLINERYKTLEVKDLALTHEKCRGRTYYRLDLQECLLDKENGGEVEFRKIKISILSLEIIINFQCKINEAKIITTLNIATDDLHTPEIQKIGEKSKGILVREHSVWGVAEKQRQSKGGVITPLPESLFLLESLVYKAEERKTDEYDMEIKNQLQQCIQDLLFLSNIHSFKDGLNSLWILLQRAAEEGKKAILSAVPLSPHSRVTKPWIALQEAQVAIDEEVVVEDINVTDVTQDSELRVLVTNLLRRTISQLGVHLPKGSVVAVLRDLRKYEVDAAYI